MASAANVAETGLSTEARPRRRARVVCRLLLVMSPTQHQSQCLPARPLRRIQVLARPVAYRLLSLDPVWSPRLALARLWPRLWWRPLWPRAWLTLLAHRRVVRLARLVVARLWP